ncbi:MAG: hypothetical protein HKO59_05270 [Phycisphaerales bacterium]|nr:hypothetical protein [Phycisphaerae bacterium]NNF42995.1 hypothetical protein [Phycisphaerales bacterium]NNM25384.1 hypothetical protein [Phycisphaerales bacterium]
MAIILRAFVAALVLLAAAAPAAFAQPASITSLATKSSLSPDDRNRIEDFASGWTDRLAAETTPPEEIRRVRGKLLEPVRSPGVSGVFRDQYSRALVPKLETIAAGADAHRAVNALIVTSGLGSERALDLLLDHASVRDEPARFRRLAAARGCSVLFSRGPLDDINANRILGAARRLQEAAREETDAVTLRHQLQAILAAAEELPPPNAAGQANIRTFFIRALDGVADAVGNSATERPVDRLAAVYPVLNALRAYFLELGSAEQRTFGRQLGPVLQKMLDATDTRWDDIQSRPRPDNQPGNFIELAERFLSTIDAIVRGGRPPSTQLRAAWQSKNRDQYRADLQAWQSVVSSY